MLVVTIKHTHVINNQPKTNGTQIEERVLEDENTHSLIIPAMVAKTASLVSVISSGSCSETAGATVSHPQEIDSTFPVSASISIRNAAKPVIAGRFSNSSYKASNFASKTLPTSSSVKPPWHEIAGSLN